MLNIEQLALLHRHGDEWAPLRQKEHPTPDDQDLEVVVELPSEVEQVTEEVTDAEASSGA